MDQEPPVVAAGELLGAAELIDELEKLGIWVEAFWLALAEVMAFDLEASWLMTPTRPTIPTTAIMLAAALAVLIRRLVRERTCAICSIRSGAVWAMWTCCSSLGDARHRG